MIFLIVAVLAIILAVGMFRILPDLGQKDHQEWLTLLGLLKFLPQFIISCFQLCLVVNCFRSVRWFILVF